MSLIEAHVYDIDIKDDAVDKNGDNHTEIRLWCFGKNSDPMLLRVRDFPVFCKAELPRIKTKHGYELKWDYERCNVIMKDLYRILEKKEISLPTKWNFIESDKLYYYSGNKKFPFILLVFNTIKSMQITSKICSRLFTRKYGQLNIKFCEMEVDIYNKMLSLRDLGTTDRFVCKAREIEPDNPERISKSGIPSRSFKEYEIEWKTMQRISDEDIWFSYPTIASFDIESYCHNHRAFPQKHYYEDIIFSISVTFQVYMKPETRKDIVIIIGPCKPLDNVIIYEVTNEMEVLEKFFDVIEEHDPDIFIGYNIFGFDYDYIDARLLDVGNEWRNVGRLLEEGCDMKCLSWNSGAYGYNKLNIFRCPGRISIDLLPYIRRDYKLAMYNLNAVSSHFLGENKVDLKAHEMFEIHKNMMDNINKVKELTSIEDFNDGYKILKETCEDKELLDNIQKSIERNTLTVKYNVQDSVLVIRLFEKLNVWISLVELSSIVRVTPTDFFTRGQQVRCIAQLYHEASHKNIVLTRRDNDFIFFNGGKVEHPRTGFWELVLCFDFNSLYPSIMIAYNICFTTLVENLDNIEKEKINLFEIDQEEPINAKPPSDDRFDYGEFEDAEEEIGEPGEKVKKEYKFGFVKNDVKPGLLPMILQNLLSNRKKVKKELKSVNKLIDRVDRYILIPFRENSQFKVSDIKDEDSKDFFMKIFPSASGEELLEDYKDKLNKEFFSLKVKTILLDSRQLGLKVSANSLYGFLGAQIRGKFSLIEGSMSVTSRGRELITDSALFFEKEYNATTVYGDSILGDEPLLLRNNEGKILIKEISSLNNKWEKYKEFRSEDSNRKEKQQSSSDLWIWSQGKWNKIKRVIRHKTVKDIYRINTHSGIVDVTEDHSLLTPDLEIIKPYDCIINKTKLACSYPEFKDLEPPGLYFLTDYSEHIEDIKIQKALLYGFFFGDGSCGAYKYERGIKNSWYLCKQNKELLEWLLELCKNCFSDITEFKIINVLESSQVYRIIPKGNIKKMVELFSICYDNNRLKQVPDNIINGSYQERLYFWKGYYLADGDKKSNIRLSNKGKLGSSQLFYIIKSLGYNCSVSCRNDKEKIFRLTCSNKNLRKEKNIIKKLYKIKEKYEDFVYDIETEDGHYCAGIGEINIKNTDSTMVYVPSLQDDPSRVWETAEIMEKKINGTKDEFDENGVLIKKGEKGIFPPPLYLEFEKAMRALFMKKKHYAYMTYDNKGTIIKEKNSELEELNVKGIILARRDNCHWLREIYEDIIRSIFAGGTICEVFNKIIIAIVDVIELNFNIIEKLSIVKAMGSNYKSKTFSLSIFSELMKSLQRPVAPGDRFRFVIVKDHLGRDKVGQKMRTNEFFLEQWETSGYKYGDEIPEDFVSSLGLYPPEEIDSNYYICNVLQNPIDKLFEYGFNRIIDKYDDFKFTPHINTRLRPVSVRTPIKMIIQILKDNKKEIDKKGIKIMLDDFRKLPTWFSKIK